MNYCGVVTEYNPFHSGHLHQLKAIKDRLCDVPIVCAMSGSFVQRAEPAIVDKYIRSEIALECGASAVLQIPTAFTIAGGERFAGFAVSILGKVRGMKYLAFGCETGNFELLKMLASIQADEGDAMKKALRELLSGGMPYSKAVALASSHVAGLDGYNQKECEDALSKPNNVLAIEYLKAIKRLGLDIEPIFIRRIDNYNHHDLSGEFASASGIRQAIMQANANNLGSGNIFDKVRGLSGGNVFDKVGGLSGGDVFDKVGGLSGGDVFDKVGGLSGGDVFDGGKILDGIARFLPYDGRIILDNMIDYALFDELLLYSVRNADLDQLKNLADCGEGMENRLLSNALKCTSINEALEKTKTKRYTHARLKRLAVQSLFGITKELVSSIAIPYAKLLAIKSSLKPNLADFENAIITKKDATKLTEGAAFKNEESAKNTSEILNTLGVSEAVNTQRMNETANTQGMSETVKTQGMSEIIQTLIRIDEKADNIHAQLTKTQAATFFAKKLIER